MNNTMNILIGLWIYALAITILITVVSDMEEKVKFIVFVMIVLTLIFSASAFLACEVMR